MSRTIRVVAGGHCGQHTICAYPELSRHRLMVVFDRVWSDLQARLDLDDGVLEAVRLAHTRMAETLVVDAGASEYRRFSKEYDAVVVSAAGV